jgi:hypothetical protein
VHLSVAPRSANRRSRVSRGAAVLCAAVLAPVLAGCGGDEESPADAAPPATTRTQTTQNERLTPAAWDEYTKVRDEARTANAAAIVTFKKCRKVIYESDERANASECLGDSLTNLTAVGKDTLSFLESQQADVGGACGKANQELTGYVKLYTASAQSITDSAANDELAGTQATVDNAIVALNRAKAASVAFDAACKPAASA